MDVHVPIVEVPNLPKKTSSRHLSKAVIQGKFEFERRDYARIFKELITSLHGAYTRSPYVSSDEPFGVRRECRVARKGLPMICRGPSCLGIPSFERRQVVRTQPSIIDSAVPTPSRWFSISWRA